MADNVVKLDGYILRRLEEPDAPGVTRVVEEVYGDTYYPRDLYDPKRIVELNRTEKLVSAVALDAAGQVVGHYALERPQPAAVAEASDAIVLPEHRHHHLLEQMRVLLREAAIRLGLTGLVGYAVTNHVFTQRAEDHFGAFPCGIALGLWPRSFHNMPQPLPQRMSFVIYFKYLHLPQRVRHETTRHSEICARIYGQYGVTIDLVRPAAPSGAGEIELQFEAPVETGTIHVRRIGADTAQAVAAARQQLCDQGAKAITLEIPLSQSGADAVCREAEENGFFFSGLGPAFAGDGDALLLQYVAEDVDPALVQIENPFAVELLHYVAAQRRR
jgi:hypothetical protein